VNGHFWAASDHGKEEDRMKQFEYLCVFIWGGKEKTTSILNEHGKEGWELVSTNWVWFYFKRPKE